MLKFIAAGAVATSVAAASPTTPSQAPETFDETVPQALASQKALEHRELARVLFQGLPTEQQETLARAGALGPATEAPLGVGIMDTHTHAAHREMTMEEVEAEYGVEFLPAHRALFDRLEAKAAAGEPVPAFCLSPDTDPKYAQALLLMIDGITKDGERYQVGDRWTTTASGGTGALGNPITLTWSYVPDGTNADGLASNLFAWLDGVYASNGGRTEWQTRIEQTFTRWGFLSGITYVYEPNDDGAVMGSSRPGVLGVRGDVRISGIFIDGNSNVLAYNYFPDHGDMFLDSADNFFNNMTQQSRRLKNVVAHEHGHGFGLNHVDPVTQTKLMEPFVSTAYLGPQTDDKLAIQRNYGDFYENNDTALTASDLGFFGDGDSFSRVDLSTDDNSDIDYYEIEVPAAGDLNVTCEIAAGAYQQGPQNGATPLTDYSIIHDLAIQIRDASDSVIATINNTGLGSDESGTASLPAAGTYFIRVAPTNATNNIQLYNFSFDFTVTAVPCPADLSGDGIVDNGDIGLFVSLFLASDLAVDFTGDGIIDNGDIGAFVALFLAGCP